MPMDNTVDFDKEVSDTHYPLLENIKFCDNTFCKEVLASFYLINYVFKLLK